MIRKRLSYSRNRLLENKRKFSEKIDEDEIYTVDLDIFYPDEELFMEIVQQNLNIDEEEIDWSLYNSLYDDIETAIVNTFFEDKYPQESFSDDVGRTWAYHQKIDEIIDTIKNTHWIDTYLQPTTNSWVSFDGDCYADDKIEKLSNKIIYNKYRDVDRDTLDMYVSAMFSTISFEYRIFDIDRYELEELING